MLFLRRTDADATSIACRFFHRVLTRAAFRLPLRYIYELRLVFDYQRPLVDFKEQEESPLQKQKIRRIGEWLSRLSHCYFDALTVCVECLNSFDRRQSDEDISHYQHVDFRVKTFSFAGQSGCADLDVSLYNILVRPGRAMEDALVSRLLPEVMRRGLHIPRNVECWDNGVEIAKAFLESPNSFEPPRFIFASTTWVEFDDHDGFKSFWPNGTQGRGSMEMDKQPNTVVVYPPIINSFSGQQLHVVTVNLTQRNCGYQTFSIEEKSIAYKASEDYAEANCIFLFIGLYYWALDRA